MAGDVVRDAASMDYSKAGANTELSEREFRKSLAVML